MTPRVRLDGRPGERIVAGERRSHPLGLMLPQPRAALDVGKEERRTEGLLHDHGRSGSDERTTTFTAAGLPLPVGCRWTFESNQERGLSSFFRSKISAMCYDFCAAAGSDARRSAIARIDAPAPADRHQEARAPVAQLDRAPAF